MNMLNAIISRRYMPKYKKITCQNMKEFIWNQGYQNKERNFNFQLPERNQLSTF